MAVKTGRVRRTQTENIELALRRAIAAKKSRDDLLRFAQFTMPDPSDMDNPDLSRYKPAAHHAAISRQLHRVDAGTDRRVIITMPPRHGKTELASHRFVPWFMGRDPYREVILSTYNQTFAEDHGRKIREIMLSPEYAQVFPETILRKDSKSAERLQTTESGLAFFAGVGGAITGRGADLFVIDDPLKNREEAESATIRDQIWNWFTSTAYTRLLPGGRVVIILTRWHEDDIVGRIFDEDYMDPEEAKTWKVLSLTAVAEDGDPLGRQKGEALWPERYPIETLDGIRRTLRAKGSRDWISLYQQRPTPDEGSYFLRTMFKPYQPTELPKAMNFYGASDHAIGQKQTNDASVIGCIGVDEEDTIWILPDIAWGRLGADQQVEALIDQFQRRKPIFWWAEKGHITDSIGPFLRERMQEAKTYQAIVEMVPSKDKLARARSIMARAAMKPIRVPAFMPWWPDALDQLLKFNNGKHDDFVDWLSWAGIGLDSISQMSVPKVQQLRDYRVGTGSWIRQQSRREAQVIQLRKRVAGW
jgi:predicted phage terminase large subunit-like protein